MIGSPPSPAENNGKVNSEPNAYFVDALLRTDSAKPDMETVSVKSEVADIFSVSLKHGELSGDDKAYLDRVVSARTGLDQTAANQRVIAVYANARAAADTARKTLAHTLLWVFITLLIGAFSASFAGTIGGRQRDNVVII
jgi:hypothetical protein